jgi:hypothetical protein
MFICECDKCNGKDWKYEIYLLRHLNRKKFTGEPRKPREEKKDKKIYKCEICEKHFRDKFNLETHKQKNKKCKQALLN